MIKNSDIQMNKLHGIEMGQVRTTLKDTNIRDNI
jgi:hypothetical protein